MEKMKNEVTEEEIKERGIDISYANTSGVFTIKTEYQGEPLPKRKLTNYTPPKKKRKK